MCIYIYMYTCPLIWGDLVEDMCIYVYIYIQIGSLDFFGWFVRFWIGSRTVCCFAEREHWNHEVA